MGEAPAIMKSTQPHLYPKSAIRKSASASPRLFHDSNHIDIAVECSLPGVPLRSCFSVDAVLLAHCYGQGLALGPLDRRDGPQLEWNEILRAIAAQGCGGNRPVHRWQRCALPPQAFRGQLSM